MSLSAQRLYNFGPFRLEPAERLLLREGQPVPLPPKAYDLLVTLVAHAGHLVTKEDLLRDVWPGTFVEEANLSYTVSLVRKALGDDPRAISIHRRPSRSGAIGSRNPWHLRKRLTRPNHLRGTRAAV